MKKKKSNPRGYWNNKNVCHTEALKYKKRTHFSNKSRSAYGAALRNGWLDEICSHMILGVYQPNKEECKIDALKYNNRSDFQKKSSQSYTVAWNNGWLNEICSHMKGTVRGFWNIKENCINAAKKCNSRNEFRKKFNGAYQGALRNNWYDECCSHMIELLKPPRYWSNNKERCNQEAKKYKTRKAFEKNSNGAYDAAKKNKWLDEICSHMKPIGNLKKRLIYVFEFPDKSVYVGLTCNSEKRYYYHMKYVKRRHKSSVYKYFKKIKLFPNYILLTNYIDAIEAQKLEKETVDKYRNDGWNILNRAKTGSLGGGIRKWDENTILKVAKKCNSKNEFHKKYASAYNAARDCGWVEKIYKEVGW